MTKLEAINIKIKNAGYEAELKQGTDYFYFVGESVKNAQSPKVFIKKLSDVSDDRWIKELNHIIKFGF